MKTPEEILKRGTGNFIHCTDYEDAIKAMIEYGNQMQKEALEWAASKVYPVSKNEIDEVHAESIKQSILKGKL